MLIKQPFNLQPLFMKSVEKWFEKSGSRNLVREKWFWKLGFFFWFEKSGWPEKKVGLYYKSTFFQVGEKWFCKLGFFFWFEKSGWPEKKIRVCRTTFLEPLFYTFLEKWLQIKWSIGKYVMLLENWFQLILLPPAGWTPLLNTIAS